MLKDKKIIIASLIGAAALAVFAYTLIRSVFIAAGDSELDIPVLTVSDPIPAAPSEHPSKLIIPALKISADVQDVGITEKGNMANPNNFTDVGWYKYGTIPGQLGSAVMAGHVDNAIALPGVFKKLEEIPIGEDVYVETDEGTLIRFIVTAVDVYDYRDTPSDLVFNQDDKAYLKLITCDGAWIQSEKTYDKRLVVTAVFDSFVAPTSAEASDLDL